MRKPGLPRCGRTRRADAQMAFDEATGPRNVSGRPNLASAATR
jgi:hypothetical protein